jgi:uncharacterized membrane protein
MAKEKKKEKKVKKDEGGKELEKEKVFAALSYLWLLSVIILFGKKENKFIFFHARQGIILFGCLVISWIICSIPHVQLLGWLIRFACWAGMLVGITKSLAGEKFEIPLVSDLAEKIKI